MGNQLGNLRINTPSGQVSTDDFFEAVQQKNKELEARSQQVQKIYADQNQVQQDALVAQKTQGDNTLIVRGAQEISSLDQQNAVQAQATRMGINPGVSSEVLDKVSDEWKEATLNSIDKQKKLQQSLEVKFFDHPVDYVVAQIGMENTIQQAEAANSRRGNVQNAFASIQSITQNLPGQMAALAKTKTDTTLQATMEGAKAELDGKLAATKINNFGVQAQNLLTLNSMDAAQINNLQSSVSVQIQKKHLDLSYAQFGLQKQQFALAYEDRMDRLETRKADRAELDDMADLVRKGAASAGFENVSAFPTTKIIQMLNMKDAKMQDFLKSGMTSDALNHPVVSENAGESARILAQHGAPLRPEQSSIKNFFTDVWSKASSTEGGRSGQYDNTKLPEVSKAANGIAIQEAKGMMGNIKSGDNTNIYAAPPLPVLLSMNPVKTTSWYENVMKIQAATGELKEVNPEQLISLTASAIKNGKISMSDGAVGIQTLFSTAAELNKATKNYIGFGLPAQVGYNTRVSTNLGPSNVNLTEPKDVQKVLMRAVDDLNHVGNPLEIPWTGYQ